MLIIYKYCTYINCWPVTLTVGSFGVFDLVSGADEKKEMKEKKKEMNGIKETIDAEQAVRFSYLSFFLIVSMDGM